MRTCKYNSEWKREIIAKPIEDQPLNERTMNKYMPINLETYELRKIITFNSLIFSVFSFTLNDFLFT